MMMNRHAIQFELNLQRERLDYYLQLKTKATSGKTVALQKWIEIHEERVHKLERQLTKAQQQEAAAAAAAANPGLKVQLAGSKAEKKRAARR